MSFIMVPVVVMLPLLVGWLLSNNWWRFERHTAERKQLLLMLEHLAEEPSEWEYAGGLYRHKASGVSFVWQYSSCLLSQGGIRFDEGSRGWRACARVHRHMIQHQKRRTDLVALKGMNEAYRRWTN